MALLHSVPPEGPRPTLSIVIPAGPGDRAWGALLQALPTSPEIERLLVLAECDTVDAVPLATRCLAAPTGRARQINAGLNAARGATVWVLHADSRLAPRTFDAALAFARDGKAAIGWFALGFFDGPMRMAINAFGANVRSRVFGLPFGDQGLIAPRALFLGLGGFDESVGRGEDHAFVWAARRAGIPLHRLPGRVLTSARRYVERGWWRTTREHLALSWRQRRAFASQPPR